MVRSALAFLMLFVLLPNLAAQEAPATPDVALRSLCMIDAKEGWAVGDDGLVLHTLDGWESWELQKSGVRTSLRSVQFLDAYVGYAVGVEPLPYGRGTGGVVLRTSDGGVTWKKLIHRELPGLHTVKFMDAETGYAFGDTNGGHPSGLFKTENAGVTWKTCSTLEVMLGWTAGTLVKENPLGLGSACKVGFLEKEQMLSLPVKGNPAACLLAVDGKDHDLWAVGTQASVMLSRQTAGKSWEPVRLPVPDAVLNTMDFHTVSCAGSHVWIAGRPGSVILHSADRGKSWEVQKTGQPLPLHSIRFVSESHGFAVGEMGTVLQTLDGGKSWKVMRRGGHRSAVMFASTNSQQIPVGTMALLGGDQGYLCLGLQTTTQPGKWSSDRTRLASAVRAVGGMTCDVLTRMDVADYQQHMSVNQLVDLVEKQNGLEQLVLALRIWRPSVVVCDSVEPGAPCGPLGAVMSLALQKACDMSGRADVFPDQISKLGLEPWQPVKVYSRQFTSTDNACTVDLNLPRPVLFAAANDFANLARPSLHEQYVKGPAFEQYVLHRNSAVIETVPTCYAMLPFLGMTSNYANEAQFNLMAGVSLGHGGQARREEIETDDLKYQLLLGATAKQVLDSKTYQKKMFDPGERRQFFTNFEYSLLGLAPMTQGERIAAQAQEFVNQGQWTMARECHLLMLDLFPTHRLAPESCRFITTMMGSSELRRRAELGQMKHITDYVLRSPASKLNSNNDPRFERQFQTQRTILQNRRLELRRWNGGAIAAGEVYSVLHPLGYGDPDLQFVLQANLRQDERGNQSDIAQSAFQWKYPSGVWHDAATTEQWLSQRIGNAPKASMHATRVPAMPKLDGKLDDDVWKNVPVTTLQQAAGTVKERTEVRMAFDDTYLYLGVTCQQPPVMPVQKPVKPRKRDDDLRSYDRISLLLDLDRDYSTTFHFEFDARGCVMEECCGDMTWNPQWFVEVNNTSEGWTAEVAIPLIELTGKMKLESEVWAANVTRIIPGQGVQAMSLPAAVKPVPEGMGLLLFDNSEKSGK